jgi:antitoxin VapB
MASALTRTFRSGNSEAVRLPRALGFGVGATVRLERVGDRIVITAADHGLERTRAMLGQLRAMPRPAAPLVREPFEYPDRPGIVD